MSKPKLFPVGHPFAGNLPVGVSPFEIADRLIAYRAGWSGGMTMKKDDDPAEDDDDDDDDDEDEDALDPESVIKVDGKEFKLKDLQRIMRKEKSQGKRSGARELLKELGFESLEDAKAAIAKVKPKKKAETDDDEDEAAERAKQRETAAEARERKAAEKERRLDLRGALRDAGVSRDNLDDAHAILDREVDAEYEEDDLEDAVEELKGRRPSLFGDDEENEGDTERKRKPARGRIPSGRPPKKKAGAKTAWERGQELAKKRHNITD